MLRVGEMWGMGMIATLTVEEGNVAMFFAIGHCSLELLGILSPCVARGSSFGVDPAERCP